MSDLLIPYAPQQALRSCSQLLLTVSCCHCKPKGGRAFSVAAPKLWNILPLNVWSVPSLASFKSVLKYIFGAVNVNALPLEN